ncbi:hypothetical protein FDENT_13289 [Fusarium denticulatum]|uniref:Uncharacterized protein n=1 Tax=Fusarium denticulatum TaxID=48507 RepID=A0A8H5WL93_9HYPO|nr:hypothetical protein FDENT_13289 [Fusarium denticulatum]
MDRQSATLANRNAVLYRPALGEIDANVQSLASVEALGRAGGVSLSKGQRGGKKALKSYGEEEEEEYEEEEDEEGDSSVPDPQDIEINYDELPLDEGEEAEAEEEEEEEEVDNEEAVTESSNRSKKARLSIESAEDWISNYNKENPVDKNDPELQRFQGLFSALIRGACEWAREDYNGSLNAWFGLPAKGREMTRPFRGKLAHVVIQDVIDNLLGHILDKGKKVLGRGDLTAIDLLDLPRAPERLLHRIVYADAPVQAGVDNIIRIPSILGNGPVKTLKRNIQLAKKTKTKAYIGSSINRLGGYKRLQDHEKGLNGIYSTLSKHYKFSQQQDVAPNLRIIGMWSNPHVVEDLNADNDTQRWLPVFCEGMIMVYLGLLNRHDRPISPNPLVKDLFSDAKYDLIDKLRNGLELPNLQQESLNIAWPLAQGVHGGMVVANECAYCKQPRFANGKKRIFLLGIGEMKGLLICRACYAYAQRHDGVMDEGGRRTHHQERGSRTCVDCQTDEATAGKRVLWCRAYDEEDTSDKKDVKWRCQRCHLLTINNKAPLLSAEEQTCFDCGISEVENGKKLKWYNIKGNTEGKKRCKKCYQRTRENGPLLSAEEQTCFDCGISEVEKGKKIKWYKIKGNTEGKKRCKKCYQKASRPTHTHAPAQKITINESTGMEFSLRPQNCGPRLNK